MARYSVSTVMRNGRFPITMIACDEEELRRIVIGALEIKDIITAIRVIEEIN